MSVTHILDVSEPQIEGMVPVYPITEFYKMPEQLEKEVRAIPYQFGYDGMGEFVYKRTYSRLIEDEGKERNEEYPDTSTRMVEGCLSILKDHYIKKAGRAIDKDWFDLMAKRLGTCIMKGQFLPGGRGIWVCGTKYGYTKGSMAYNNCGFADTSKGLVKSVTWLMDALMCGCGVGFNVDWRPTPADIPEEGESFHSTCPVCSFSNVKWQGEVETKLPACDCPKLVYHIHDSREGWVKSVQMLLQSYLTSKGWMNALDAPAKPPTVFFDYSLLRPAGVPIKGFGGTASGPDPLERLHNSIRAFFKCFHSQQQKEDFVNFSNAVCGDTAGVNRVFELNELASSLIKSEDDCKAFLLNAAASGEEFTYGALPIKSPDEVLKEKLVEIGPGEDWDSKNKRKQYETILRGKTWKEVRELTTKSYDCTRLISDIMNAIGCCVVAGNVRRSSEICLGSPRDKTFLNLKNYAINPERTSLGWMSNNTCVLDTDEDFECIPDIAERVRDNGEPGILNRRTAQKCGRVGRYTPDDPKKRAILGRELEHDKATGCNPCGEIPLESFELCNLAEVFPTRCANYEEFREAVEMATFYASTISLLPSHWSWTNEVVNRNHRIGVSITALAELYENIGFTKLTTQLKRLYEVVAVTNRQLALAAGVPESIRKTTVKPSGTVSQLAGCSSGVHFPIYQYCIRRIRVSADSPLLPVFEKAGYVIEVDKVSQNTKIIQFPLHLTSSYLGKEIRTADQVKLSEQAMFATAIQGVWADNQVSCTLYFDPETEGNDIEHIFAMSIRSTKSLSALPHATHGYEQAPYESITKQEYEMMKAILSPIEWDYVPPEDAAAERGCTNDSCLRKL